MDEWHVEECVRGLTENPDACLLVHPSLLPPSGAPRIRRDGHRVHLVRYLHDRLSGYTLDPVIALLPGGCKTRGCLNPLHRIPSRRRTLPKRNTSGR